MRLPLFETFWALGGLIMVFFGLRILFFQVYRVQVYKRPAENKLLNYFAKFAIFSGLGFILAAPSGPIIKDPVFLKLTAPFYYFLLFIAAAYLTRLSFTFLAPKFEKKAFWIVMFLNFLFVFFMIRDFILSPNSVQYYFFKDFKTGITSMEYPPSALILDVIICIIALLIPGILFIVKGLKSGDRKVMKKAMLLGLGMISFAVGGASNAVMKPAIYTLISAVSLTLGFFFILWGVFYSVEKEKVLT